MLTRNQYLVLSLDEPWEESRPIKVIFNNVLLIDGIPKELIVKSVEDNVYYCLSPRYIGESIDQILEGKDIVLAIGKIIDLDLIRTISQNEKSKINIGNQQFELGVKSYGIGMLFVHSIHINEYKYLESWLNNASEK